MNLIDIRNLLGIQLFLEALTAPTSDSNYSRKRLAFLGDAVLRLAVIEGMNKAYSFKFGDGKLKIVHLVHKLVSRDHLGEVAKRMRLQFHFDEFRKEFGLRGPGTGLSCQPEVIEAIIGALYIMHGYKKALEFVVHNILNQTLIHKGMKPSEIDQLTKIRSQIKAPPLPNLEIIKRYQINTLPHRIDFCI